MNLERIQELLRNFQKTMQAKNSTVRGQWNSLTLMEKISQVQLARRMNLFGVQATNEELAQLFYCMGFKNNSMGYNDFITLMETDPSQLSPKTRKISQKTGFEHQTLHAYENDYNKYCRRTATFTPSATTRQQSFQSDLTTKKVKKVTRPFTASKTSNNSNHPINPKKAKNVIRNSPKDEFYDDQYQENSNEHTKSCHCFDSGTFSYEPCHTCLDKTLPKDKSNKQMREATLRSFSNTSIQRQSYDGIDVSKVLSRDSGISTKDWIAKISDIAYTNHPNSMSCFLKWRDSHHDLLDANDLRNGLKYENNITISMADAQKIIEKYGGPMNQSTFNVMLHDGNIYKNEKPFDDYNI